MEASGDAIIIRAILKRQSLKAHGIVAQSIAGIDGNAEPAATYSGHGGTVTVTTDGRISAGGGCPRHRGTKPRDGAG